MTDQQQAASEEHKQPGPTPDADNPLAELEPNPAALSARDAVLAQNAGRQAPAAKRPPAWLIVLTLAIPVTVGTMWYSNWYGRPLSCTEVTSQLTGENQSRNYHAITQVHEKLHEYNGFGPGEQRNRYFREQLSGCLVPMLEYAEKRLTSDEPPATPVFAAVLRTLGSFAYVRSDASAESARAERMLNEIFVRTKSRARDQGDNRVILAQTATALAQFGDDRPVILETLVQMLSDPEIAMQANGAAALGIVGNSSTAAALKTLADSADDLQVRAIAEVAYAETKDRLPD